MPPLHTLVQGLVGALAVGVTVLGAPLLRPWYRHWGLGAAGASRSYPGDDLVPQPRSMLSCAIEIDAAPAAVWPWFLQLGCHRAGWYSYDLLDNAGRPSAEHIDPAWQQLSVGDIVSAVPKGGFGFPVALIEPERALVLAGTLDTRSGQPLPAGGGGAAAYFSGGQAFVIEPRGPGRCRLVFRMRTGWNPSPLNALIYRHLLEPISFVMARRMLINLKRRAERLQAGAGGDATPAAPDRSIKIG